MLSVDASARTMADFRGDFDQLSQLMELSWSENPSQSSLYTAECLQSYFLYPGASCALAPTIYHGSRPVGFVAGFPRSVQYKDKQWKVLVITFLTVATEYKKKGYGIVLWSELVKRAQALGYDGMVNYCVDGDTMNGMILGSCRLLNLPITEVRTVPYWSRVLLPRDRTSVESRPSESAVELFVELAKEVSEREPFARTWSKAEAEWQCEGRLGSVVAKAELDSRRGMLVGYVMPLANASRTKCLFVEDVLWGDLQPQERDDLLKRFLERAALAGVQMAVLPHLGYADLQPFHAARFRPSQRTLHAYLTIWNGEPCTQTLDSMYLDVF